MTKASQMTHRERVLAVIRNQPIDTIPLFGECPMDVTVWDKLLPPSTGDEIKDAINQARFFDNSCLGVGFGINSEIVSQDENHKRMRYETGAVWQENYKPTFCRELLDFPIKEPGDALKFRMPDVHAPGRYDRDQIRAVVKAYHDEGYYVGGGAAFCWGSIYQILTSMENIMKWMLVEPEAAHACFDMMSKFSIESARVVLDCGVDGIYTGSDLGTGHTLMFSPALFYEYVFPWLKELCDLAHEGGTYVEMHSHGHIQDIMDGICDAGVDVINPVGPSDHNDLAFFKEKWGKRIVFHGGVSTRILFMNEAEIRAHVHEVMEIGRRGGRFVPRTESGIPPMPTELAMVYLDAVREERMKGYS